MYVITSGFGIYWGPGSWVYDFEDAAMFPSPEDAASQQALLKYNHTVIQKVVTSDEKVPTYLYDSFGNPFKVIEDGTVVKLMLKEI